MDKEIKFYICKHCGNIVTKLVDSKVPVVCCGENMDELIPNTVDASVEKHIPVIENNGSYIIVKVGSIDHPMTLEHHISWIVVVTEKGFQTVYLEKAVLPKITLTTSEKIYEVYAYCNLHGLWKKEV